nr:hypothetical protein [Paraburkholderia sp.]
MTMSCKLSSSNTGIADADSMPRLHFSRFTSRQPFLRRRRLLTFTAPVNGVLAHRSDCSKMSRSAKRTVAQESSTTSVRRRDACAKR